MARKQETNKYPVDDGEVEVTLQALGGVEGSKLGVKLGSMLGPSLIALFVASESQSSAAGAEAGRLLFEKLTPNTFEAMLKELTKGAQVKTLEGEFEDANISMLDDLFSGNVTSLYRLLFDAIRLNFRNFSQGLGISSDALGKLKQIAERQMAKVGELPKPAPSSPPT